MSARPVTRSVLRSVRRSPDRLRVRPAGRFAGRFVRRTAAALAAAATLFPGGLAEARPCWSPPVSAPVTDPFREPTCAWCPGNRGLEYGTSPGSVVRAVATGRVSWAGTIAGRTYVVVRQGGGRRVTYGNLRQALFDVGDLVVRGQVVGRAAGRFHLGVRVGDRYVDPAPMIGRLVGRPRLIPVDGSPPNPAPPPRLRCSS